MSAVVCPSWEAVESCNGFGKLVASTSKQEISLVRKEKISENNASSQTF